MNRNGSSRMVTIVVGVWLVVSTFVWPHTPAQTASTLIVGVAAMIFAAAATRAPQLRWAHPMLAVWLVISVWVLPTYAGTFWSNLGAAIVMFMAAVMAPRSGATQEATGASTTGTPRVPRAAPRDPGPVRPPARQGERTAREARH
jgi:hypothetical protein